MNNQTFSQNPCKWWKATTKVTLTEQGRRIYVNVASIRFSIIGLIRKGNEGQKAYANLHGVGMRLYVKFEVSECRNVHVIPGQTDHSSLHFKI